MLNKERGAVQDRFDENKRWSDAFDKQIGPFEDRYLNLTSEISGLYDNAKKEHAAGINFLVRLGVCRRRRGVKWEGWVTCSVMCVLVGRGRRIGLGWRSMGCGVEWGARARACVCVCVCVCACAIARQCYSLY
jgi:hypothetical protein